MKTSLLAIITILSNIAFFSCKKSDTTPTPLQQQCYLYYITDSADITDTMYHFYNTDHQLIMRTKYQNGYGRQLDTFAYTNKLMTFSAYKFGTTNDGIFYSRSFYTYAGNLLTTSDYYLNYLGLNTFASKCNYVVDTAGRTTSIDQIALRPGLGAQSHYTRYEFDTNGNLHNVFLRPPGQSEYLIYEFLDYDNKPNPIYKHFPFTDYDFYVYGVDFVSKNNRGKFIKYSPPAAGSTTPVVNNIYTYSRYYNSDGYLIKQRVTNTTDTKVYTKYYAYKCQ